MTVKVKICGLTNIPDTLDAIELGADYLGFNFYPDSKRYVSPDKFQQIVQDIPQNIEKVGVFVNCDAQTVVNMVQQFNLDYVQFHGDETAEFCSQFARPVIKAIRLEKESDLEGLEKFNVDYFLVDAFVQDSYGGTGVISNWDLARKVKELGKPIFLAGGLTPDNVDMAISSVKPYGVDVASGLEAAPGKKDYRMMEEFIIKVKAANN